jgi:hypothetical protein
MYILTQNMMFSIISQNSKLKLDLYIENKKNLFGVEIRQIWIVFGGEGQNDRSISATTTLFSPVMPASRAEDYGFVITSLHCIGTLSIQSTSSKICMNIF